jgi:hypothetical protein
MIITPAFLLPVDTFGVPDQAPGEIFVQSGNIDRGTLVSK